MFRFSIFPNLKEQNLSRLVHVDMYSSRPKRDSRFRKLALPYKHISLLHHWQAGNSCLTIIQTLKRSFVSQKDARKEHTYLLVVYSSPSWKPLYLVTFPFYVQRVERNGAHPRYVLDHLDEEQRNSFRLFLPTWSQKAIGEKSKKFRTLNVKMPRANIPVSLRRYTLSVPYFLKTTGDFLLSFKLLSALDY